MSNKKKEKIEADDIEITHDREEQIKQYMNMIKKNQEDNKNSGSSSYEAIDKNIKEITALLDGFKEMAKDKDFVENKKTVTKKSIEYIPKELLDSVFGKYVNGIFDCDKKYYSQRVAKINQSLKNHKLAVISSKKGNFRLIFHD
jgi:hypothetical protein